MFSSSLRRVCLGATLVSSLASAQEPATSTPDSSALVRRGSVSVAVIQSRPQGAFGRNVGLGYGIDGTYLLALDRAGLWSLRVSLGAVGYGDESRRSALSEAVGGRVSVNVTTTNYIVPMSIGPQLSWSAGPLRPYVNAGVAAQAFFTESRVKGTESATPIASTTNHSAMAASWVAGGGIAAPLFTFTREVQLELGAQYYGGATARYLASGSIVDLPVAQISVTPLESTTHMMVMRLGARVKL